MAEQRPGGPPAGEGGAPARVAIGHLRRLAGLQGLFPERHADYLRGMKSSGAEPRVVYDVGANVLHWTRAARAVWPGATFFAFEAMEEAAPLYEAEGVRHHLGVLSDRDGREVRFYVSPEHPSGNSYYRENPEVKPGAERHFLERDARTLRAGTLDAVVGAKGWPLPDLVKMDVQGAELDVLKGARRCLRACRDVILELPSVEYNRGAPPRERAIAHMEAEGFALWGGPFHGCEYDGDYHFVARR